MVLELPELARENQNWKIYRAHILDSAATEGVVSHLTGAAPKPFDLRELEAWNWSNSVAKYIMLEVISDSLLERLMHHELAHTLFSHLAAIFGDHDPIAIEPSVEWSHPVEPLQEDSHPKSDGADSARTANTVESTIADVDGKAALGGESAERAYRVDLESRENGIDHGVGPADVPNKSETPDGGNIPCVCLGDASWHACDPNGRRSRTDGSSGQADGSRGSTDTSDALNQAEMPGISRGNDVSTYLDPGDAKRRVDKTGGIGSHADMLNGLTDIPSVERDANRPATHQIASEYHERRQNRLTYLVDTQNGTQTSQRAVETIQTRRPCIRMRHALEMTREQLKTRRRTSKRVESNKRHKTHLQRPKTGRPSPPVDGVELASTISTYTYHGTRLLRRQAKRLRSDHLGVESRRLRPALMAETSRRGLAMVTTTEMETTEMEMARRAAATSIQHESAVCS